MKTRCLSCGGPATKKMQKGGSTDSTKRAPYVSPKGAFYPDEKSLKSGCAKNPNSPGCKKVIKTMSPAEAAKIKGRLQNGGDTSGYTNTTKGQISTVKLQKGGVKKYQNGGMTKADPYGVSSEKKRYPKSGPTMGPTKIVRKKVDPKAPKTKKIEGCFGGGCSQMQKGGVKKYQNGGVTKDGRITKDARTFKFPPIPTNTTKGQLANDTSKATTPSRQTAFEKRQNKRIERAKTRSAVASIEGEGTVKDKRNNRANRFATAVGTGRQKVSRTSSISTTSNTNSGNTNVSSGSDSGSTSGSKSGSTSGVSGSGNSKIANEANTNSKNKRYQNGGSTSAKYEKYTIDRLSKKSIKRPTAKKTTVNKGSNSSVNNSGNANINNSANVNSNNKRVVITKKDNSINKSTNSRNRYQNGGSTSSVNNSGNSSINNSANVNSNNTRVYKKKVDNSINKSTNSRNTRNKKIGTFPYLFN